MHYIVAFGENAILDRKVQFQGDVYQDLGIHVIGPHGIPSCFTRIEM